MQPVSIVKHFDVLKYCGLSLLSGSELQMMNKPVFKRADEALGTGVIKAIAFARHARADAVRNEPLSVRRGGILAPRSGSHLGKTGAY